MPGVIDTTASPAQQALQLANQLQAQGLSADEAAAQAMRTIGVARPAPAAPEAPDLPPVATDTSPADDGVIHLPRVVVVGRALPRDALGNAYETDSQGNQLVYLAGGGLLALTATNAAPISGGAALTGMALLQRLATAAGTLALMAIPGNAMQGNESVQLNENRRFERRPGEVYGTIYERNAAGDWLATPDRVTGWWSSAGFVVMSEEELARMRAPTTTPATPQPPANTPPLPAWADRPEPLPGYAAAPPAGPTVESYPAEQMRLDDLIIESRGLGEPGSAERKSATWDLYRARGGEWGYEQWSNVYDANQTRAAAANAATDQYRDRIGWGTREVSIDIEVDGRTETRRIDIADPLTSRAIEYKTGYQSASVDNLWEVARDAELVQRKWDVEWVFRDQPPSQPLLDALERAGIRVKIGD